MVSLRKKFGVYFFISALVLVCLLMPAELQASIPCCKNGTLTTCPDLPNGQQYDISGCQNFKPINPDVPTIIDPDKPIVGPIASECTSGQTQYKPSGSCGTSSRSCCSDGTWSEWDALCPTTKTCPTSSKPSTKESCHGGYRYRTVTCNKSTGTWTTGAWGACDCSDSEYESVLLLGGGTCCQRKDGTGLRCNTGDQSVTYTWQKSHTDCRNQGDCGWGSCSGSCSNYGDQCSTWVNNGMSAVVQGCAHYDTGERGICQVYTCR